MVATLILGIVVGALVLASGVIVVAARRRAWSEGALGLNALALGGLALLLSQRLVALALAGAGLAIFAMALQASSPRDRDKEPASEAERRGLPVVRVALCVLLIVGLAGAFCGAANAPLAPEAEGSRAVASPLGILFTRYGSAVLGIALVTLTGILAGRKKACPSG